MRAPYTVLAVVLGLMVGGCGPGPRDDASGDDDSTGDDDTADDDAGDDDAAGDDDSAGDDDTTGDDDVTGDDDTADDDSTGDDDTSGPTDCSPGPGDGIDCEFLDSYFYTDVRDSVNAVVADHPEWFEDHDGWTYAAQPEDYMNSVVSLLNTLHLCAIRDPSAGDEVAVKHDNAFAESFDILTWEGYVRTGEGIYNATCSPAWF